MSQIVIRGKKSRSDDKGASLLEYSILAGLIALVVAVVLTNIGEKTSETFENASGAFNT